MDFERYSRQISIDKFGEKGQRKLAQSCVTVIGAGGLGSPAIYYLAAAGVGNMRIVDADKVEISNLNRQLLYFERDIGKSKAGAAKEKVNLFNSGVNVSAYDLRADSSNIADIIKVSDIVLSCVDNLETRFMINESNGAEWLCRYRLMLTSPRPSRVGNLFLPESPGTWTMVDLSCALVLSSLKRAVVAVAKKGS
jgi:molybdopterin/thiamine biosynthesis adenylyltransferase